ncbi:hypothetical protein OE749_12405 [Aestuariibacter sp. AA17]|uniref:Uncharacterized protein n=1 Tax=Fluctibacter corallii TaxID=2984329 RepID=A0ABT3AA85_9ALTE|nr:hypothetical protein [Aestuariibacter sp. AA17]MCV2885497.1 hypothetical protein [Aestuariibacter sp. AA17]
MSLPSKTLVNLEFLFLEPPLPVFKSNANKVLPVQISKMTTPIPIEPECLRFTLLPVPLSRNTSDTTRNPNFLYFLFIPLIKFSNSLWAAVPLVAALLKVLPAAS